MIQMYQIIRKCFLTVFLLMFIVIAGFSQTITVFDQETKQPLEGVNIFTQDRSLAQVTNSNGQASISSFKDKENIIFSYVGYQRVTYSYEQILGMGNRIGLEQKSLTMSNIVVSASRWSQDSKETPVSIARVTPSDIRLQNPQTAADLLGVSNEVFIQKSQLGGGSPVIRGFATNRVLLVVDGVRMNNAIFRGGNLQNVISLDANAIENTEITFGPGSVLYGSDAIGGVMSFNTITPRFSFSEEPAVDGSFLTRVSSANWERTGHFDFNLGFQNWASVTSVTYTHYDDLRMGDNGPSDYLRREFVRRINGQDMVLENNRENIQKSSGYSQLNLMQKFRFRPDEHWDLQAGVHYSTTTDLPRYDRLTERDSNGQFSNAEWYYGPQQWFTSNVSASYNSKNSLFDRLKTTAAFQNYEESRNDRDFQDPNRRNRNENVRAYSLNLDFEKSLTEESNLSYGLEGVVNTVHSDAQVKNINTGATSPTSSRYPDGSTWQSYAAFVKYTNNLSDQWTLTLGSRYNRYIINASFSGRLGAAFPVDNAELNRGALTGSAGAVYRPTDSWQINAHASTGFRAPNIDDIGKIFDSEPGSVVVPNPNLDPEYAYNFELGIQKLFGKFLKVDAAAFYTILDDALARRDFTLNGQDSVMYDGTLSQVQAIQNVASARVWGVQADVEISITPNVQLNSNISFQEGEEQNPNGTNEPLRHVAPTFGSTHLIFDPGDFKVDLYADYNGEIPFSDLAPSERGKPHLYASDGNGNPYAPSWYTINIKSSYEVSESISLNLGLENITDQRYRPYSSGISAAGRNVIFGIRGNI